MNTTGKEKRLQNDSNRRGSRTPFLATDHGEFVCAERISEKTHKHREPSFARAPFMRNSLSNPTMLHTVLHRKERCPSGPRPPALFELPVLSVPIQLHENPHFFIGPPEVFRRQIEHLFFLSRGILDENAPALSRLHTVHMDFPIILLQIEIDLRVEMAQFLTTLFEDAPQTAILFEFVSFHVFCSFLASL
jgi:hypothetical protein